MSPRYSPDQKAAALVQLQANGGDIASTALQTGISERTLYAWRRRVWLQQLQQHTPSLQQQQSVSSPPAASTIDSSDEETFTRLRQQIVSHIGELVASLTQGLDYASPYQRALVLSQLLSHLKTLDAYLPQVAREHVIRIEYEDPDEANLVDWDDDSN